jgi:hypothetical protein
LSSIRNDRQQNTSRSREVDTKLAGLEAKKDGETKPPAMRDVAGGKKVFQRGQKDSFGGGDVNMVQELLRSHGHDDVMPTGKFGKTTEGAVKKFQKSRGLKPTGKIDAQTLRELKAPPKGEQAQTQKVIGEQKQAVAPKVNEAAVAGTVSAGSLLAADNARRADSSSSTSSSRASESEGSSGGEGESVGAAEGGGQKKGGPKVGAASSGKKLDANERVDGNVASAGKDDSGGSRPDFDADETATELYESMNGGVWGLGTDEKRLHSALDGLSPNEVKQVKASYKEHYERDLTRDIKKELSGTDLKRANAALKGDRMATQADKLEQAMSGIGTDEGAVFEVLEKTPPAKMQALKDSFSARGYGDLDKRLKGELSGYEEKRALALTAGDRPKADAMKLKDSMAGMGTDEKGIYTQLEKATPAQRKEIEKAYDKEFGEGALRKDLKSDMSREDLNKATALLDNDVVGKKAAELERAFNHGALGGTDEQGIRDALKGTTDAQRKEIFARYEKDYDRPVDKAFKSELSGKELEEMQARASKGDLDSTDDAYFKMQNGDIKDVTTLLQGKSGPEVEQMRQEWSQRGYGDMDKSLLGETSGRDKFEMKIALRGNLSELPPGERAEAEYFRASARADFETSGFGGWFMDAIGSDKGDLVRKNMQKANAAYVGALGNDGVIDNAEAADISRKSNFASADVESFRTAKDTAAETAGDVAAITAATVATVATGGGASGLLVATVAAAGAKGVTATAIRGDAATHGDIVNDVAEGAFEGVTAAVGGAAASKIAGQAGKKVAQEAAEQGVKGAVKNAGRKAMANKAIRHTVAASADGAIGGTASGFQSALHQDWGNFREAFDNVMRDTAVGVGAGMASGAAIANAGVIRKATKSAAGSTKKAVGKAASSTRRVVGDAATGTRKAVGGAVQGTKDMVSGGAKRFGDSVDNLMKKADNLTGDLAKAGRKIADDVKGLGGKGKLVDMPESATVMRPKHAKAIGANPGTDILDADFQKAFVAEAKKAGKPVAVDWGGGRMAVATPDGKVAMASAHDFHMLRRAGKVEMSPRVGADGFKAPDNAQIIGKQRMQKMNIKQGADFADPKLQDSLVLEAKKTGKPLAMRMGEGRYAVATPDGRINLLDGDAFKMRAVKGDLQIKAKAPQVADDLAEGAARKGAKETVEKGAAKTATETGEGAAKQVADSVKVKAGGLKKMYMTMMGVPPDIADELARDLAGAKGIGGKLKVRMREMMELQLGPMRWMQRAMGGGDNMMGGMMGRGANMVDDAAVGMVDDVAMGGAHMMGDGGQAMMQQQMAGMQAMAQGQLDMMKSQLSVLPGGKKLAAQLDATVKQFQDAAGQVSDQVASVAKKGAGDVKA